MNMILHDKPTAIIVQGNTLADPKFKEGDTLKTFDYVVANIPFSDKRWSTGVVYSMGKLDPQVRDGYSELGPAAGVAQYRLYTKSCIQAPPASRYRRCIHELTF